MTASRGSGGAIPLEWPGPCARALRCLACVAACALLGSCALAEKMRRLGQESAGAQTALQARHDAFGRGLRDTAARRRAQEVARPWLAGRPRPLARELSLPLALRANVSTTLLYAEDAQDLPAMAQRITAATSIPVYVSPECLLPVQRFAPRLAGGSGGTDATRAAPQRIVLAGGRQPLSQILDRIAAQLGVAWRYAHGRIEFYRTETRVFDVRALTLDARAEASLGLSGNSDTEGFASTSRTSLSGGKQDLLAVVRARLEPFLSRAGTVVAEPGASASVVVTDTPEVLRRIALYLEHENRSLTRRVRLVFEEITLALQDDAQAGLDWNLVFSSASAAAALAVPGQGLVDGGSLAVGLNTGSFKGSEAIIKALGQAGTVLRRSSVPVLTLNRRPVTHAVRTTFSYIDRVQTTALGSEAGMALPSVSVSQKDVTVGSLLTLVPDAQDDGRILLSLAYDNTVAQPLKSVTFGDKSNPLQLQQIMIDGNGTVQQLMLLPGQPLLVSGFDRKQDQTEARRLNPGLPMLLGGSDRASSQRLTTVVLITAQVEEGY
jgi:type IVB pilus formation R64 PilN family outer membrane protein